ncbi:interleukin-31 [Acinonyx jubatus]|uniref:Interleukin-31 n=1 Tax=Acinonyx jubatus TaxID=32536 RepID=A0ABM3NSN3_ACIJB|nr:interleukin-31 [Acinonyx jubatus]
MEGSSKMKAERKPVREDSGGAWPVVAQQRLRWLQLGWAGGVWPRGPQHHFLSPGPARFALFLLCCMETLLPSHMAPTHRLQPSDVRKIILELRPMSKGLLQDYLKKEMGLPESNHSSLPCLSSDSQLPHINGSAILPYFRAIRPLSDKNTIDKIIEQLDKLKFQREPEAEVSMPADNFERKNFILAVLQQFSACLEHVLQSLNSGSQ